MLFLLLSLIFTTSSDSEAGTFVPIAFFRVVGGLVLSVSPFEQPLFLVKLCTDLQVCWLRRK